MTVKKMCSHAGCKTLIAYHLTYCDKHLLLHKKQKKSDTYQERKRKGGKYFRFYHSKEWTKASRLYKIKNPCCEDCLDEGIVRKADVTDHVIELRDDWSKRLDETNFRSRCHYHHNKKTREVRERRATP